jgi:hypothetical protein
MRGRRPREGIPHPLLPCPINWPRLIDTHWKSHTAVISYKPKAMLFTCFSPSEEYAKSEGWGGLVAPDDWVSIHVSVHTAFKPLHPFQRYRITGYSDRLRDRKLSAYCRNIRKRLSNWLCYDIVRCKGERTRHTSLGILQKSCP